MSGLGLPCQAYDASITRNLLKMPLCYGGNCRLSTRVIWPFALAFFEGARVLVAWCELRSAFRHFRIDRIAAAETDGERYPSQRHALIARWREETKIDPAP